MFALRAAMRLCRSSLVASVAAKHILHISLMTNAALINEAIFEIFFNAIKKVEKIKSIET